MVDINSLFNSLCKCDDCLNLYKKLDISFIASKEAFIDDWLNRELIEDKLNDEANQDSEENRALINKIDNCNINLLPTISEMPIEKVYIINKI